LEEGERSFLAIAARGVAIVIGEVFVNDFWKNVRIGDSGVAFEDYSRHGLMPPWCHDEGFVESGMWENSGES
jgi:hypothetical protein